MAVTKITMACAGALALYSIPALAQDRPSVAPNKLTVESKRPPLQLNDKQRAAIEQGLVTENTQQKTPPKFEAKVGAALPASIKVDVMPPKLIQQDRSLQPYGYAKLAKELLVIDPMKKTIIAIIPRLQPATGKDLAPADWAATRGRELTGQEPQPASSAQAPEPAGDSGDTKNGNEQTSKEK